MNNKGLPTPENFEQLQEFIEKIEKTKQLTALKQIEASDKDNERQFQYAMTKENNQKDKWNKSFLIGSIATGVLTIFSLYLIIIGEKDIGLALLASTFTGVFGFIAGAGSCNSSN